MEHGTYRETEQEQKSKKLPCKKKDPTKSKEKPDGLKKNTPGLCAVESIATGSATNNKKKQKI